MRKAGTLTTNQTTEEDILQRFQKQKQRQKEEENTQKRASVALNNNNNNDSDDEQTSESQELLSKDELIAQAIQVQSEQRKQTKKTFGMFKKKKPQEVVKPEPKTEPEVKQEATPVTEKAASTSKRSTIQYLRNVIVTKRKTLQLSSPLGENLEPDLDAPLIQGHEKPSSFQRFLSFLRREKTPVKQNSEPNLFQYNTNSFNVTTKTPGWLKPSTLYATKPTETAEQIEQSFVKLEEYELDENGNNSNNQHIKPAVIEFVQSNGNSSDHEHVGVAVPKRSIWFYLNPFNWFKSSYQPVAVEVETVQPANVKKAELKKTAAIKKLEKQQAFEREKKEVEQSFLEDETDEISVIDEKELQEEKHLAVIIKLWDLLGAVERKRQHIIERNKEFLIEMFGKDTFTFDLSNDEEVEKIKIKIEDKIKEKEQELDNLAENAFSKFKETRSTEVRPALPSKNDKVSYSNVDSTNNNIKELKALTQTKSQRQLEIKKLQDKWGTLEQKKIENLSPEELTQLDEYETQIETIRAELRATNSKIEQVKDKLLWAFIFKTVEFKKEEFKDKFSIARLKWFIKMFKRDEDITFQSEQDDLITFEEHQQTKNNTITVQDEQWLLELFNGDEQLVAADIVEEHKKSIKDEKKARELEESDAVLMEIERQDTGMKKFKTAIEKQKTGGKFAESSKNSKKKVINNGAMFTKQFNAAEELLGLKKKTQFADDNMLFEANGEMSKKIPAIVNDGEQPSLDLIPPTFQSQIVKVREIEQTVTCFPGFMPKHKKSYKPQIQVKQFDIEAAFNELKTVVTNLLNPDEVDANERESDEIYNDKQVTIKNIQKFNTTLHKHKKIMDYLIVLKTCIQGNEPAGFYLQKEIVRIFMPENFAPYAVDDVFEDADSHMRAKRAISELYVKFVEMLNWFGLDFDSKTSNKDFLDHLKEKGCVADKIANITNDIENANPVKVKVLSLMASMKTYINSIVFSDNNNNNDIADESTFGALKNQSSTLKTQLSPILFLKQLLSLVQDDKDGEDIKWEVVRLFAPNKVEKYAIKKSDETLINIYFYNLKADIGIFETDAQLCHYLDKEYSICDVALVASTVTDNDDAKSQQSVNLAELSLRIDEQNITIAM